jgi:hypothetical protein
MAALDPVLQARAAELREPGLQHVVQAFAGILLIQLDSQRGLRIHIVANGCNLFLAGRLSTMQTTMRQGF